MITDQQLAAIFDIIPTTYIVDGSPITAQKYWIVDFDVDMLKTAPAVTMRFVRNDYSYAFNSYLNRAQIDIDVYAIDTTTTRGEPVVQQITKQLVDLFNDPQTSKTLETYGIYSIRVLNTSQLTEVIGGLGVIYRYVITIEVITT